MQYENICKYGEECIHLQLHRGHGHGIYEYWGDTCFLFCDISNNGYLKLNLERKFTATSGVHWALDNF